MRLRILVREVIVPRERMETWMDEDTEVGPNTTLGDLLTELAPKLRGLVDRGQRPFVTLKDDEIDPATRLGDVYGPGDTVEVWL